MKKCLPFTLAGILSVVASPGFAATCVPVQGLVSSTPDAGCGILARAGNFTDEFLLALVPNPDPGTVCFSIKGTGTARFTGFSGLTMVGVVNQGGLQSATPLVYPLSTARAGMTTFTAAAALTGTIGAGRKLKAGTLFTRDTGTITSDGVTGQVLKIVGGEGDFANATGTIAVAGQEVGGAAVYVGQVCTAD